MKNINYVINGVLAVAVVILFVMQFSGKKESKATKAVVAGEEMATLPVAYVNVDSLLSTYNYSIDLNEVILKKQENARANITQKARSLSSEVQSFQKKVQNNAFLTPERAQQEQQRLMKKEQDLGELEKRLAQELMTEQQKMNEQLRDTVVAQIKMFNADRGYQIIFSNTMGDNILWAADQYDITAELIKFFNQRYNAPSAK